MHEGELTVDRRLVVTLIAEQFPRWAGEPLERVESAGTVHAIYRLGDDKAVRLPLLSKYSEDLEREVEWVAQLAPHLPLESPIPLALGEARDDYPSSWSVVRWVEGETATPEVLGDLDASAVRLGDFVSTMRNLPHPGFAIVSNFRGLPLAGRAGDVRSRIDEVSGEFDRGSLSAVWDEAQAASDWDGEPAWFHGDLHPGNLVSRSGELTGVIDYGELGAGDPAIDAIAGWWLFTHSSRETFREAGRFDDSTWSRGRGWGLWMGITVLPYYAESNPTFADMARRALREVLADVASHP